MQKLSLKYSILVVVVAALFSCKEDSAPDTPFIRLETAADSIWAVGNAGGEKGFCVVTNRAITSEQPNWVTVSSELHAETTHVMLNSSVNDTDSDRTGIIILSTVPFNGSETKLKLTVKVHQSATNDSSGGDSGGHH